MIFQIVGRGDREIFRRHTKTSWKKRTHCTRARGKNITIGGEVCWTEPNRVLHNTKDEAGQQRMTISSLDREKDGLQLAIDEKTEKIARLNEDLLAKVFFF